MRAIFTYPNNPFYIDPDYLGDDTSGFQRRIKDLKDGTYHLWYDVQPPTASVDDLMTTLGKYYNYYDTVGVANITRYDMWAYPLAELNMEQIPGRDPITWATVTSFPTLNSNNKPFAVNRFTTATAHGFVNQELVIAPSGADIPSTGTAYPAQTAYVKVIDSTTFELYSNSALTENNTGEFEVTSVSSDNVETYNNQGSSDVIAPTLMRLKLPNGDAITQFSDGDQIQKTELLDNTNWTGDGATLDPRYVKVIDANTLELFTDAGLTTPVTVTPEYSLGGGAHANGAAPLDISAGPQTKVFSGVAPQSYGGSDQLVDAKALACWGQSGEQRIKAYITASVFLDGTSPIGTFTNVSPLVGIGGVSDVGTNPDYYKPRVNKPCWLEVNAAGTLFDMYDAKTGGNLLELTYESGDGTQTLVWTVYIEIPALNQSPTSCTVDEHTWFKYQDGSTAGGDAFWPFWRDIEWNSTTNTAHHRYTPNATMWLYGANTYTYQDSGNVTQPGAVVSDYAQIPGGPAFALRSSLEGTPVVAATFAVTLDGLNRVTGITTTGGIYETPSYTQFQQRIDFRASEYVPPAQTPVQIAAAEDNFYLNDVWYTTTTEFDSAGTKNWPRTPVPATAELTETQPSVTTQSQAGIKYTRSGGFSKSGIELTYPLLNEADFRVLQNASQLAQGQRAVFRYYYRSSNNYNNTWVWQVNNSSNQNPRVLDVRDNDRVFLVEGMESNESQVLKAGQIIKVGGNYNGEHSQNVADVDANVFGEVESRIAYKNGNYTLVKHDEVWLQPDYLVVTLADDEFTYTARTDGLYDVSVRFDFAWYHSS